MTRKAKAIVDYFPHFCKSGKTLYILENNFKNDGYAFWFKLLEILGSSDYHYYDCRSIEALEYLSAKTGILSTLCEQILDKCAQLDAIDKILWKNRVVFSQNFVINLESVYNRRIIKCMQTHDLCIHLFGKCTHPEHINAYSGDIKPQSRVEESRVKEITNTVSVVELSKNAEFEKQPHTHQNGFNFSKYTKALIKNPEYLEKLQKQFPWSNPDIAYSEMHRFVLHIRSKPESSAPKTEKQTVADFEKFFINSKHNPQNANTYQEK